MKTSKFKQTEIGMIPEDWEIKTIPEVVDIFLGGTPKTTMKEYWGGTIKWASAKDVANCKSRYLVITEKTITKKGVNNSAAKILPKNTIVITARGTVGKIALLSEDMSFNQTCYGLKAKKNIDPLFIYYKLVHSIKNILSASYGTVFSTITIKTFDTLKLSLPLNIEEQRAIAKILSDLDAKIELLQKQNETLEKIGQAIFKHWFVDFEFPNEEGKPYKSSGGEMVYNEELGKEIPKGWIVSTIGKELKTVLGGTPSRIKKEYWNCGTVPWINSGAINEFPIMNPTQFITKEGLDNSAAKLMPKGTVVLPFVISVGKEVKISILGIESSGNQSVLGILENEFFSSGFVYYWLQHKKEKLYLSATGGAQQHINKREVDSLELLISNRKILGRFNLFSKEIFKKIFLNSEQIQSLQRTRDLLLPKLMTGKLRVPVEVKE